MSLIEFERWITFYRMHPFDDLHRYHRPAALIATPPGADIAKRLDERLQWLQPDPGLEGYSAGVLQTFKAFGVKPPPRARRKE